MPPACPSSSWTASRLCQTDMYCTVDTVRGRRRHRRDRQRGRQPVRELALRLLSAYSSILSRYSRSSLPVRIPPLYRGTTPKIPRHVPGLWLMPFGSGAALSPAAIAYSHCLALLSIARASGHHRSPPVQAVYIESAPATPVRLPGLVCFPTLPTHGKPDTDLSPSYNC